MFETRKYGEAPHVEDTDVLQVRRRGSVPTETRWCHDAPFTIGRLPDNDLALGDDRDVSGHHAEIRYVGGVAVLHDLGSANGTLLNGQPIGAPERLTPGDWIGVGGTQVVFSPLATGEAQPPPPASDSDTIFVRRGTALPYVVHWRRDHPLRIGRLPENSVPLTDDLGISRRHAELRYVGGAPVVRDLGSANGTLLNGRPVQAPERLTPGDRIGVGGTELVFNPAAGGATLEAWLRGQPSGGGPAIGDVRLPAAGRLLLGRAAQCDVLVPDPRVAERHACVQGYYGDYVLTDLRTASGTSVNGHRITEPVRLAPGDVLQLGETRLVFECREAAPEPAAPAAEAPALGPAAAALRGVEPFDRLPADLLGRVAAVCEWVTLDAGADLVSEAREKQALALLILVEGKARAVGTIGERETQDYVVADLGRGDFVGERALTEGQPYPRRVVADTPLRALRLTREVYLDRLAADERLRTLFGETIPRVALRRQLARTLLMRSLSTEALDAVLGAMQPVRFAPGEVLARRGEPSDRFFAIADGRARILVARESREVALGYFGPGECLGEAVADPGGVYSYTVLAETAVHAYALTRADFESATASHAAVGELLTTSFELAPPNLVLEKIAPFNALPPQLTARIASQMRLKRFRAGEVIIEQDDLASAFYIVKSGTVAVSFRTASGEEKAITTLGAGQHFGEAALLTGEGRNATVRAVDDCQLWALYKDDFDEAIRIGRAFQLGAYFSQDLRMRSRPRRLPDVEVVQQTEGGEAGYVLHTPSGKSYLRLSEQGMFVWNLLDGDHTINDLCVAYLARYNTFDLELIASTVAQLQALGFIDVPPADLSKLFIDPRAPGWQRALTRAFQALTWRKEFGRADGWFAAVYRRGGRLFYTPPGLLLIALSTLAGLAAFVAVLLVELRGDVPGREAFQGLALAVVPLGFLLITVLHELGHGLTCKHFGRRVNGAGVGIAYLFPYAFVGTSDIWMAGKGARIAVSAAGPLVNLWTGSLCALAALAVPDPIARSALFALAALSYLLVISNIHPFMELDGYYVLVDWLEMPSLRKRSLQFLRRGLWQSLSARRFDREARILAAFGVMILLFTLPMGLGLVLFVHDLLVASLQAGLPAGGAELVGWAGGALIFLAFLIPFAFELELVSPQGLGLQQPA